MSFANEKANHAIECHVSQCNNHCGCEDYCTLDKVCIARMNATRPLINARTACPSSRSKSQPLWKRPRCRSTAARGFSVCAAFRLQTLFTPYVRRSAHFSGGQLRPSRRLMAFRMAFLPYFSRMASTASCIRRSRARADCSSRRAVSAASSANRSS